MTIKNVLQNRFPNLKAHLTSKINKTILCSFIVPDQIRAPQIHETDTCKKHFTVKKNIKQALH